ncbi:STAS domain-containing protein [Spirochaeta dissipatitropha]
MAVEKQGTKLVVSGDVQVADCGEIHELLREMSRTEKEIVIDSSGLVETDFSFVQLLAAMQKYAAGHNIKLDYSSSMATPVRELIRLCGLNHVLQV